MLCSVRQTFLIRGCILFMPCILYLFLMNDRTLLYGSKASAIRRFFSCVDSQTSLTLTSFGLGSIRGHFVDLSGRLQLFRGCHACQGQHVYLNHMIRPNETWLLLSTTSLSASRNSTSRYGLPATSTWRKTKLMPILQSGTCGGKIRHSSLQPVAALLIRCLH